MHNLLVLLLLFDLINSGGNTDACNCKCNCCMACDFDHTENNRGYDVEKVQMIVSNRELNDLVKK